MVRHSKNSSAVAEEFFECEYFIVLVDGLIKESVPLEVFFRIWDFNYGFTS